MDPPEPANLTTHQILREAALCAIEPAACAPASVRSRRKAVHDPSARSARTHEGNPVRRPASRLAALALLLGSQPASARGQPAPPPVPIVDQADLFSDRALRTWSLEMPEARWRELRAHATEKRWAAARLTVEGVPVGVVGVRFKGSAGTLASCFEASRPICAKLPLKIRFHLLDPGPRFFGLQRLNFHSMRRDRSLVRERLAYRIFEDAGVAA